jgi:serine/threonine-protein kinase
MIGKTVGHFKIIEKIGEGGMGIVYKAEDRKLDREVALKFLPSATLSNQNEKDRFVREAKAAAALNHPNIAHIYAIEEIGDQMFIAMEYIDGENLHEKLNSAQSSPLPLDKAIDYAIQISHGLKAAHDKDIVHRDVKSANMMVTKKGTVKIMDFGLAKLSNKSLLTHEGTTLGTVAYMSPEQAQGNSVDHRSDIWSLGVILYEIISGKLPFIGDYEQAVIYNILNNEYEPLTAVRSGVPIALDGVIAKCLTKDPDMRYQHVDEIPADLKAALENKNTVSRIVVQEEKQKPQATVKSKSVIGWQFQLIIAVTLVALAVLLTYIFLTDADHGDTRSYRFELTMTGNSLESALAISPDGKSCAYTGLDIEGKKHLYLSKFDQFERISIASAENFINPFFSPDGNWLGYFNGQLIKKVAVSGGAPIPLGEARGFGVAHWSEDNEIVYSVGRGIFRLNSTSGVTDTLLKVDVSSKEVEYRNPYVLPGGRAILYSVRVEQGWRTDIIDLDTGRKKELIEKGISARYISSGHLVYQDWNEEALFIIPFDTDDLEISGAPQRVVEQARYIRFGATDYSFSSNGVLMYSKLSTSSGGEVCWVDKNGIVSMITDLPGQYVQPRISPDGKKLILRKIGVQCQLWLYDIERGTLALMTMEGDNHDPIWSPDGRYFYFHRAEYGITTIFRQRADGSQGAQLLAQSTGFSPRLTSLSGNGQLLLFNEENPFTGSDVLSLSFNDPEKFEPILQEKINESSACLSPNGKWMIYTSDESGREDVYLRPFPGEGPKILVSKGGGSSAKWSPDGKSIYYISLNKMMKVSVSYQPELTISAPQQLFSGDFFLRGLYNYDISPDGEKFVMIYDKFENRNAQIYRIVLNWFDELKQLVKN